jgi:ABC-type multidrug transport system fused ATPase/permease subunit
LSQRQQRLDILNRHIQRLDRRHTSLKERSNQLASQRLVVFFGGLVVIFFSFQFGQPVALGVTLVWMALFGGLIVQYQRVAHMQKLFHTQRQLKADQVARLTLDWDHIPVSTATAPPEHPFATDIDITGAYSLHRLLDTTTTQGGSERLLSWLIAPTPNPETILSRQSVIKELLNKARYLRERLRLTGQLLMIRGMRWDGAPLVEWLERSGKAPSTPLSTVLILGGLALVNIVLFALSSLGVIPPLWIGSFVIYGVLTLRAWGKIGGLFTQALSLQTALDQLRTIFAYLEREQHGQALSAITRPFQQAQNKPSAQIKRISQIVSATSIQRNPVVWIVLNFFLPYDVFFAYLLGKARGDLAEHLPQWLDTWYEIEALNALTTFAYLNPDYTFPTLSDQPILKADSLGHPLIPYQDKVSNDFLLTGLGQVVMITGSNMSGKSSFLRTLGLNMVLAYAGCVTDADKLEIGLFRLFSCIRVTDSVVDGISYFYAEVRRLRALLDALKAPDALPVFFLIDEIFRGTNNRERLIGSESFIRALVGQQSMGLISTHDLELVKLADDIPQISNYHFREHIQDDRMVFDYILRSGPSPTTNALKIMAIEGLPVNF